MKKAYTILLFTSMLLVSCNDNEFSIEPQEVAVSVHAELDEDAATKAGGGFSTLDKNAYDLRYILEVYDGETSVKRIVKTSDDFEDLSMNVRLLPRAYKFVIWADFVLENSTEDKYYTTASLKAISTKELNTGNDDSNDAYTFAFDITVDDNMSVPDVVLKRPLAKITFVNTGLSQAMNTPITIKYNTALSNTFNALTGVVSGSVSPQFSVTPNGDYSGSSQTQTIAWDYVFCDKTGMNNLSFTFSAEGYDGRIITDISMKPDNHTIVKGKLLIPKP